MESPKTLNERAYLQIRGLILDDKLPVAEFLSQRMLARSVNCTVIPVREALRRLESEGLIESVPRWGVRIPRDTEDRVRDRYFLRETLELAAVRRIRSLNRPDARVRLTEKALACDRAVALPAAVGTESFADAHFAFHSLVAELSESPLLQESMERLNLRSLLTLNALRVWGRGVDQEGNLHGALVDSIFADEEHRALAAVAAHVRRGLEFELKAMREAETPAAAAAASQEAL